MDYMKRECLHMNDRAHKIVNGELLKLIMIYEAGVVREYYNIDGKWDFSKLKERFKSFSHKML